MLQATNATKVLPRQTLNNFNVGDGQCLKNKGKKLEVTKVSVFRRACCKIAPSISLKREHQLAVEKLQHAITDKASGRDNEWAALVLQKARVGSIKVVDGKLIVNASALVGRRTLDRILETTTMSKEELIEDQKGHLNKKAKDVLLGKRKQAPALDRPDSLRQSSTKRKRSNGTDRQRALDAYRVTPLSTGATPGLKKTTATPLSPDDQPLVNLGEPEAKLHRKRPLADKKEVSDTPFEISQRKIALVKVRRKTPIQRPLIATPNKTQNTAPPVSTSPPLVDVKRQVFDQLMRIEPGLVPGDFQVLSSIGIFDDINANEVNHWQPGEYQQRADFCLSALRRETPNKKSPKPAAQPKTALQQQLESTSADRRAQEKKLFKQVRNRSCNTEEEFQAQLSLFQMMQGFQPELDLKTDFPILVKKGTYAGIDSETTQSWDHQMYRGLAEESIEKVGKRLAPKSAPSTTSSNTTASQKKVLPFAQWSTNKRSHHPMAYALACTSAGSVMEPGTIAGRLMPFVAEKLQKDYVMPLKDVEAATVKIFNKLGLNPGTETEAVYGQVSQIARELRAEGGAYLKAHPLPKKPETPIKSIPDVAWTLPEGLHNRNYMIAFGELHKAKLVTRDEFVELYNYLPGKAMVSPEFKQQLEVYKWLKGTGRFTRNHFVEGMRAGVFPPEIVRQLLEQKKKKTDPNNLVSKLIVEPVVTAAAFERPKPVHRHPAPATQPVQRHQRTQKLPVDAIVKPAGQRLAGIQALRRHPGMENFSNTCYFNSTCQQLSFAIPPETIAALRVKPMTDRDANAVRSAFCELMTMLSAPNQNDQVRQSNVQRQLLNACYHYGLNHPDSDIRKVVKSDDPARLSQEDASDLTRALSEILRMKDHSECTLRETSQFALTVGGTRYTRVGRVQDGELTRQVSMVRDIDTKPVTVQDCMDFSVASEIMDGDNKKHWTADELTSAGCPHVTPGLYPSEKSIAYVSDDLSKLKTHTMSLSVYSQDWDDSLGQIVSIKQPKWGRKIVDKAAERVTMPVFDRKTQSLHQVPMALQSAVIHMGNTKDGGHYVTLVRSNEGSWMLFNDTRSTVYSSLTEFLNEERNACPTQLSYAVVPQ